MTVCAYINKMLDLDDMSVDVAAACAEAKKV